MRVAIIGGGAAGLLMLKRLVESGRRDIEIGIFERKSQPGSGMPYSKEGSGKEHVTNVSDSEIPELANSIADWVKTADPETLKPYGITADNFNELKVLPRLLFGQYLSDQFQALLRQAAENGIAAVLHLETSVSDIMPHTDHEGYFVITGDSRYQFDRVIICIGHRWPKTFEEKVKGYFDSPYPPAKLRQTFNHAIAIRGSSLTAIDALRTVSRGNGKFEKDRDGRLRYARHAENERFRIVMHSIGGLLPAVRFHLEDSHLKTDELLSEEEIRRHIDSNNGFLSLDYIFENNFKNILKKRQDKLYPLIAAMTMEEFVEFIMSGRERRDAFELLKLEYLEAERSIDNERSIYWKELLAILSFAMNYPAKYFSAEDMMRLKSALSPLISVVIAFVPQSSCEEIFALHDAGVLDLVAVDPESSVDPIGDNRIRYRYTDEYGKRQENIYETFIDCIGQPALPFEEFPFKSLISARKVAPAFLRFRSAEEARTQIEKENKMVYKDRGMYFLKVPGLAINDNFGAIDASGEADNTLFLMAVPYIGGYNPDYSGLDFCEEASGRIAGSLLSVTQREKDGLLP